MNENLASSMPIGALTKSSPVLQVGIAQYQMPLQSLCMLTETVTQMGCNSHY